MDRIGPLAGVGTAESGRASEGNAGPEAESGSIGEVGLA